MKKHISILLPLLFAFAPGGHAQQPQTQADPAFAVNAAYANGVAPGYRPSAGSGLTLNVGAGTASCATPVNYAGGTLTMANNATNYVYLNGDSSCLPAVKSTAFTANDVEIATVVTASGAITTIADDRTPFVNQERGVTPSTVSGTSYTFSKDDRGAVLLFTNGSAIAVTLPPQSTAGFGQNWFTTFRVKGAGTVTVTTSSTIDGGATLIAPEGEACTIISDNAVYTSRCEPGVISAGAGVSITPTATGLQIAATVGGAGATQPGVQNQSYTYASGGGTANAQTLTLSPAVGSYAAGQSYCWLPTAANSTTTPTLAVNGLAAKTIVKVGGAALAASDLTTTAVACAIYDGTNMELQNPQTSSGAVASVFTRTGAVVAATNDYNFNQLAGSASCGQLPALTGDVTTSAGSCATTIANNAVSSAKSAVVNTRRTCMIVVGADNGGAALANADLGPQLNQCFVPYAATVTEIEVMADAGTPNVIVQRSHLGTPTALLSGALATASAGAVACSNTGGTTGLDGTTTCTNTLQNTAVAVGDWIGLTSGTAGGTAKRMSIAVTMTVN